MERGKKKTKRAIIRNVNSSHMVDGNYREKRVGESYIFKLVIIFSKKNKKMGEKRGQIFYF